MQPRGDEHDPENLGRDFVEEMVKYGIKHVRIDNFLYGGFRYTNLDDAIAEAKRRPVAAIPQSARLP